VNRDGAKVFLAAGIIAALVLIAAAGAAGAAELVCPPKRYFCWEVRAAAASFGERALEARARACGWSDLQIAIARRCLSNSAVKPFATGESR